MTDTLTPETLTSVPTLSLATADADPEGFADWLGGSFERFGFAVVEDHGIDPALIEEAWAVTAKFFARPDAEKRAFFTKELAGQRGYTPFRTEIARGAATHDLKEFWHVGRTLTAGQSVPGMPDNLWPDEPARFRPVLERLYAEFDRVGLSLLSAIARWLDLDPRWFDDKVDVGNSILRLLHYPPIPLNAEGERAGAHEDINLITLLLGAEEAGLELKDRETGEWLAVDPPAGALVVNVGDMLQRLTNHRLPSTSHRVVNPPPERRGQPRYSMPFFLHFNSDVLIETLPGCVSEAEPDRYPDPITADDYLHERLVEIGLLKG